MPHNNNFHHSQYSRADPGSRVSYRTFQTGPALDSSTWRQGMARIGAQLANAQVKGVLFLSEHPFTDLFGAARLDEVGGLKRGYSRGISGLESLLALLRPDTNGIYLAADPIHPPLVNNKQTQHTLDDLAQEVGNFTTAYVGKFSQALGQEIENTIPCSRYVCSSTHNHVGRVEASMDLIQFLQEWSAGLSLSDGDRLLLIGHGHAGQVLALLSNLITRGESEARARIFEILAKYWQSSPSGLGSVDILEELYKKLLADEILCGAKIDIVTLGTPVRYGWDTQGIGHLLHIVNHRSIRSDGKRWLAKMELPQTAWEIPYQTGGDYVQQLAVAGTDHLPLPEAEQANLDFREMLEPYDGFERWLECTRRTTRCANDGECLLVEYGVQPEESPRQHLYGHGCYTQSGAMLFTATEIAQSFYAPTEFGA